MRTFIPLRAMSERLGLPSLGRFNFTMDPSITFETAATCTTCRFKEDKSNYWTAVLYFKHSNGSYMRVRRELFSTSRLYSYLGDE